jgi:pyruvate-formate lyase
MLWAAQASPEQFRSLVVRVAGYSAYFVELDKDLQDEIIRRAHPPTANAAEADHVTRS